MFQVYFVRFSRPSVSANPRACVFTKEGTLVTGEMKSEIRRTDPGSIRVFILSDQDWLYWSRSWGGAGLCRGADRAASSLALLQVQQQIKVYIKSHASGSHGDGDNAAVNAAEFTLRLKNKHLRGDAGPLIRSENLQSWCLTSGRRG